MSTNARNRRRCARFRQHHPFPQIVDGKDVGAAPAGQVIPRVSSRTHQGFHDIAQVGSPHPSSWASRAISASRKRPNVRATASPSPTWFKRKPKAASSLPQCRTTRDGSAFGQRVGCVGMRKNRRIARKCGPRRFTSNSCRLEVKGPCSSRYATMFCATCGQAGYIRQQLNRGRVQIYPDLVHWPPPLPNTSARRLRPHRAGTGPPSERGSILTSSARDLAAAAHRNGAALAGVEIGKFLLGERRCG